MSEAAGLINVYICRNCGGHTVTKNRDEGTTPFGISCRVTEGCKGEAFSSLYRVSQKLTPDLIWIKPTPAELAAFLEKHADKGEHVIEGIRRHVAMGGLLDIEEPNLAHRRESAAAAKRAEIPGVIVNNGRAVHFDLALGNDVTVATCSCGWRGNSLQALREHVEDQHEPPASKETTH